MNDQQHNMLYSCVYQTQRSVEQMAHEHALAYVISGKIIFNTSNGKEEFGHGSIGLIRRNELMKTVKVPDENGEACKTISIFIDQQTLRDYAAEKKVGEVAPYTGEGLFLLSSNPFLKAYFDSLIPYFDEPQQLNQALSLLKTREAIELILRLGSDFSSFLFDFSEPYKIDLQSFMVQNFMYNIPIKRFAYLTGRSLATFKRDFEKVFHTAPGQWLQLKRLQEAYYLLKEKGSRPSEVYLEVGFEDLSHFSYAFKNTFGVSPSKVHAV